MSNNHDVFIVSGVKLLKLSYVFSNIFVDISNATTLDSTIL